MGYRALITHRSSTMDQCKARSWEGGEVGNRVGYDQATNTTVITGSSESEVREKVRRLMGSEGAHMNWLRPDGYSPISGVGRSTRRR
jgi:pyruvate/2-oxoacid:ferredoxin oxidoreductase alpha subunit